MKSEKLRQAKALIADPQKWTKGRFYTGEGKNRKYCAIGAVREVYPGKCDSFKREGEYSDVVRLLNSATEAITGSIFRNIVDLNDSSDADAHSLVMASFDKAINNAEWNEQKTFPR